METEMEMHGRGELFGKKRNVFLMETGILMFENPDFIITVIMMIIIIFFSFYGWVVSLCESPCWSF